MTAANIIEPYAIQNQYLKLSLLDLHDQPLNQYLEGYATAGSISINGSSAVRRTANLTLAVDMDKSNITDVDNALSINKRVKLELGIQNGAIPNSEENIEWQNLGIYQIITPNCNYSSSGLTVSLQLKDKMCLLNGECGGIITNLMIHSPIEGEDGELEQVLMKELITAILDEFSDVDIWARDKEGNYTLDENGNRQFDSNKIEINNIADKIMNIVRWVGQETLQLTEIAQINEKPIYQIGTPPATGTNSEPKTLSFNFNEDIGYQEVPYTWAPDNGKDLQSNPGDTVVSLLDKIKNKLGNFEYFFDVNGKFIFQEIPNGIRQGSAKINLTDAISDQYLVDFQDDKKSVYTFNESALVTAYGNNPQYSNIKNDIVCWGSRGKDENALRYHLLIDQKPMPNGTYDVYIDTDQFGVKRAYKTPQTKDSIARRITPQDWRHYLYLDYVVNQKENKYNIGRELQEEWPKIYDIEEGKFYLPASTGTTSTATSLLNSYTYFIDMLDPNEISSGNAVAHKALSDITITEIGQRQKSITEKGVNTVFNPQPPKIYYLEVPKLARKRAEIIDKIMDPNDNSIDALLQVNDQYAKDIAIGTASYSAYDCIRTQLNEVLGYNEAINISCIPIFGLEPNMRITVTNDETHIAGDFMVNSITIPLAPNGMMNISATRIIEKI